MFSRLLQSVATSARAARVPPTLLTGTRPAARPPWAHFTRAACAPGSRPFSFYPCLSQQNDTKSPGGSSLPATDSSTVTPPQTSEEVTLQPQEPRLQITFTCTVPECGTRSAHEFTKRSYERGIVIVQCPGCGNRHLIADHIGWFKEGTEDGKFKTIEDLMRKKGETVRRGQRLDGGEVIEYVPE